MQTLIRSVQCRKSCNVLLIFDAEVWYDNRAKKHSNIWYLINSSNEVVIGQSLCVHGGLRASLEGGGVVRRAKSIPYYYLPPRLTVSISIEVQKNNATMRRCTGKAQLYHQRPLNWAILALYCCKGSAIKILIILLPTMLPGGRKLPQSQCDFFLNQYGF